MLHACTFDDSKNWALYMAVAVLQLDHIKQHSQGSKTRSVIDGIMQDVHTEYLATNFHQNKDL